jgi:hypothetical protein
MIRLSLKGLAKYIEGSPAGQRKVLQDFKFPDGDESYGMRMYYQDAVKKVLAFHRTNPGRDFLKNSATSLLAAAAAAEKPQTAQRLRHNARALKQYEEAFGARKFEILAPLKLSLAVGDVTVSVVPDLHVRERGKVKLLKLEFSTDEPSDQTVKILTQCLYEAAVPTMPDLVGSSAILLDVPRGRECKGARAGARMWREIEAACQTIAQVWPSVEPPKRSRAA